MPLWSIVTHLGSILAFVDATVNFVKAVADKGGMPDHGLVGEFIEALRGVFKSGLIPMSDEHVKAVDQACLAIEDQLKKA